MGTRTGMLNHIRAVSEKRVRDTMTDDARTFMSDVAALLASGPTSPPPAAVVAAVERMCTPLDPSILRGETAAADARCMALIRAFVLGGPAAGAPPVDPKLEDNVRRRIEDCVAAIQPKVARQWPQEQALRELADYARAGASKAAGR